MGEAGATAARNREEMIGSSLHIPLLCSPLSLPGMFISSYRRAGIKGWNKKNLKKGKVGWVADTSEESVAVSNLAVVLQDWCATVKWKELRLHPLQLLIPVQLESMRPNLA